MRSLGTKGGQGRINVNKLWMDKSRQDLMCIVRPLISYFFPLMTHGKMLNKCRCDLCEVPGCGLVITRSVWEWVSAQVLKWMNAFCFSLIIQPSVTTYASPLHSQSSVWILSDSISLVLTAEAWVRRANEPTLWRDTCSSPSLLI